MSSDLPAPVGKLIDVGGYRLHLHMTGDGGPTVVLEAGGGSWSLDWHMVQSEVASFTRVCSYDRAGFGWSDSGSMPRTSEQIARELNTLLEHAGVPKPYVMVGASFGGHTARLYAKLFPDEVAGIILLDARHEMIDAKMPIVWRRQKWPGSFGQLHRFLG